MNKKLKIANLIILIIGSLGIVLSTLIITINSDDYSWYIKYLIFILFSIGAISGLLSVYYSNSKSLMFFWLGSIATLFKLSYPIIQIVSGAIAINTTVIYGQLFWMVMGCVQYYYWRKWNKESPLDNFVTKNFSKDNTLNAINMVLLLFIGQTMISYISTGNNGIFAILDSLGGTAYLLGAILMMVGNIWCFLGFFVSDLIWIYWSISDLIISNDGIMIVMAMATLMQAIAYAGLAIAGYIQWKKDLKVVNNN